MNDAPRPPLRDDRNADAFDRRLRVHYRQATTQLSARTQAQLQQHVRTATSSRADGHRSRRIAWSMAAACSLAVVFGLGQRWRAPDNATRSVPAATAAAGDAGELVATLDETPDLYLWVASDDAAAMTSE